MSAPSTLRDGIEALSPPWFGSTVATRLLYSIAVQCDVLWDVCRAGAKAHMPGMDGYAPSALPYMGSERQLDRYALESDVQYAARLQTPHDTHRGQGGPRELINQLQLMCTYRNGGAAVPIRAVNNSGAWITRASLTSEFIRTKSSPNNWVWDAFTTRWWRGWVIIDTTNGPWTVDIWGTPGTWGDGGTWGSDATKAECDMIQRIVRLWKSAHETVQIIAVFDSSLFEASDLSPPNPSGTSDTFAWQAAQAAIFGRSVT